MGEAGRPTDLTEELFQKIRGWVLEGKNIREMAELCDHPVQTLYHWASTNYLDFQARVDGWQRDRLLMLAERNIGKILGMDADDKDFTRVIADMSKFTAETLGKDVGYAKRTELGQKGGKDLPTPIFGNYVQHDDGHAEGGGDA